MIKGNKKKVSFFSCKFEEPYETKLANLAEELKEEKKTRLENRKGRSVSAEEMRNKICYMLRMNHNESFILHLIESNANVIHGPVFPDGSTLLHIAVRMGKVSIVECLASKKCHLDAQDEMGNTPLHLAYLYNSVVCVSALIDLQCNEKI